MDQVILILRVDMGDAPLITPQLDRPGQTRPTNLG